MAAHAGAMPNICRPEPLRPLHSTLLLVLLAWCSLLGALSCVLTCAADMTSRFKSSTRPLPSALTCPLRAGAVQAEPTVRYNWGFDTSLQTSVYWCGSSNVAATSSAWALTSTLSTVQKGGLSNNIFSPNLGLSVKCAGGG